MQNIISDASKKDIDNKYDFLNLILYIFRAEQPEHEVSETGFRDLFI